MSTTTPKPIRFLSTHRRVASWTALAAALLVGVAAFAVSTASGLLAAQSVVSYWVDCEAGLDTGDGTRRHPFTSIERANQVISVTEYDNLVFARGTVCISDEPLVLNVDDVAVYQQPGGWSFAVFRPTLIFDGQGLPHGPAAIEVSASRVEIYDLRISLNARPSIGCDGQPTPNGSRVGISVEASADDGVIGGVDISGFFAGVMLRGSGTEISGSNFHDNNMINIRPGSDDDVGAMGVLIWSDDNRIVDNRFWNNHACSPDYGLDGASVEIWSPDRNNPQSAGMTEGAGGNLISGNRVNDDQVLVEMGAGADPLPGSLADNRIVANSFRSLTADAAFVVLRGQGGGWGPPAVATVIDGNWVAVPDAQGDGVVCDGSDCVDAVVDLFTVTERNQICAGNWAMWSPNLQVRQTC